MPVETYRDWRIDTHDIALFYQQFARLVAQLAHLILSYGPTCAQLCDGLIEIATADAHDCLQPPVVAAACLAKMRRSDAARCSGGAVARRWRRGG
jgi:hypothetical protein